MSELGNMDSALTGRSESNLDELVSIAKHGVARIAQFVEAAAASTSAISEHQEQISAAFNECQARLADLPNLATQASAARTQISDEQAIIATKSDHIQKAQEHADKVRGDLDRVLTSATQQLTEAEGLKSRTQSAADLASELLTTVRANKVAIDADAAAVASAKAASKDATAQIRVLADKSATIEEQIAAYEARLVEFGSQCETQLQTIIGLLPGATGAGLAHAFDQRRQTFLLPRKRWQWLFVGSILALVALASTGLWHAYGSGTAVTYDELLRLWLSRLPVAGALVWLALHASRESALAKRLEEDYGYKSAVAASFQGFQKQMAEIGGATSADSPLAKLCADTLATIAAPPGRIYDKHQLTISPGGELSSAANSAAKSIAQTVKSTKV